MNKLLSVQAKLQAVLELQLEAAQTMNYLQARETELEIESITIQENLNLQLNQEHEWTRIEVEQDLNAQEKARTTNHD